MHEIVFATALLISITVVLAGCSFYNHPYPGSPRQNDGAGYDLRIVQADDFGSFWDANAVGTVVTDVENQSNAGNILLFLFVHGWHHNAAPDDNNLRDFKRALQQLSYELSQPNRRKTRQELTGSPDIALIGIFVGWRGRSLPSYLDYATMWWRKAAAERVGEGDVGEFLERLQRIYLRANAFERYRQHPGNTPFMGLVTLGHSFGARIPPHRRRSLSSFPPTTTCPASSSFRSLGGSPARFGPRSAIRTRVLCGGRRWESSGVSRRTSCGWRPGCRIRLVMTTMRWRGGIGLPSTTSPPRRCLAGFGSLRFRAHR
jgi:hypothetical protein